MPRILSIQQATVRRARELAGGVNALSRALHVTTNDLDEMLAGRAAIPPWLFLRAVDYVNEHDDRQDPFADPSGTPPAADRPGD